MRELPAGHLDQILAGIWSCHQVSNSPLTALIQPASAWRSKINRPWPSGADGTHHIAELRAFGTSVIREVAAGTNFLHLRG